jgi:hypothetical protein
MSHTRESILSALQRGDQASADGEPVDPGKIQ